MDNFVESNVSTMLNLYDYVKQLAPCPKLISDEFVFAEYKCEAETPELGIWSHINYIAYVTSGMKKWKSTDGEWLAKTGDSIFCKRGGYIFENFFEEEFCSLVFFFTDDFIREVVDEFQHAMPVREKNTGSIAKIIMRINVDISLQAFFDSVASYFLQPRTPSKELVKLKFKELLVYLMNNPDCKDIASYFRVLLSEDKINLRQVMEKNFRYNLPLEEYARMCNRSLSTFKRDFNTEFGISPGKWLSKKRLEYARLRLISSDENVNDISFHSGFENNSHFVRAFKKSYGLPPNRYRMENQTASIPAN